MWMIFIAESIGCALGIMVGVALRGHLFVALVQTAVQLGYRVG